MKLLKDQGEIFKLFDSLSSVSELSAEERIAYRHDLKIYRDNLMFEEQEKRHIEEAEKRGEERGEKRGMKKGREEGRAEGREEGIEIGMEKGMKKGREEGRAEKMEALRRTAKYLLSLNMPVDQIVQATGLDIEQIEEIKKNMA